MSAAETSYPQVATFVKDIRRSAQKVSQDEHVAINTDAIERVLTSPAFSESFDRLSSFPGLSLPLNFASHLDELNALSILALLNFGSSFEIPLREQTGYGASNAIKALIFSMYITSNTTEGDLLSAKAIASMSSAKVAELMRVDVMVEKPHPKLVGVTVGEAAGPMHEYVELVTKVLNETGQLLLKTGYPNLGFFVVEALKEGSRSTSPEAFAGAVLAKITKAIPAFRDSGIVNGGPVYILNKALFLLNAISERFGSISPPPFPIPSSKDLPAFADGILPSVLVNLGVLDLSASPKLQQFSPASPEATGKLLEGKPNEKPPKTPPQPGLTVTDEQALILRAAAIVAVDTFPEVAAKLHEANAEQNKHLANLSVPQVHSWLSAIAKERLDYRNLPTLIHNNTVAF